MRLIFVLLLSFVVIGVFFRKYDAKTRWVLLLACASLVAYATFK